MTRPLHHHLLPVLACVCFFYGLQNVYKQSLMGQGALPEGPPADVEGTIHFHAEEPATQDEEAALKDPLDTDTEVEVKENPMRRGLHPGEVIRKKIKQRWDRLPTIRHDDGLPKKSGSRFA